MGDDVLETPESLALPSSPRARAVELWLERLSDPRATEQTARAGRGDADGQGVLFILDNDFGELTLILYLVLGQNCFRECRVLVSPRLYEKNRDALPGRLGAWTSEADLIQVIDTRRPRIVVFASAYLLPVHDLLTVEALERVIEAARRQGAAVVTADPFLGLISQWSSRGLSELISIDIPTAADERLRAMKRGADALLHRALAAVERMVRPLPHLYPSPTDLTALTPAATDDRNVCFFNEALLLPSHLADLTPNAKDEPVAPGGPHWMFVISLVDFQTQVMFLGAARFAAIVAQLLTRAAELGRHAMLLGPDELRDLLKRELSKQPPARRERIHLLSFCSFRRAMSLLLTAEYCFYWNVVSHTILMQLSNGRPVILFDRGHLVRALPALYERVIAWYYQGWEPPYLDHEASLSLAALTDATASHARHREGLMARFRRAPSPADLLESLLGRASGCVQLEEVKSAE